MFIERQQHTAVLDQVSNRSSSTVDCRGRRGYVTVTVCAQGQGLCLGQEVGDQFVAGPLKPIRTGDADEFGGAQGPLMKPLMKVC